MDKLVLCKYCAKQCVLDIKKEDNCINVEGHECEKGIEIAQMEINNNKDILTTLVRIKGNKISVLPVKSSEPIDKKLWIQCSKALSRIYVGTPIKIGDTICKNILNTGVDIVSAKNVDKNI